MIFWQKISRELNLKILQRPKKYSLDNLTQKHLLYKQFVAWSCDGWSVASLTDQVHNPIYQELIDKKDYFTNANDERIYLDLRASAGYTNKMEKLERNDSLLFIHYSKKCRHQKTQVTYVAIHQVNICTYQYAMG